MVSQTVSQTSGPKDWKDIMPATNVLNCVAKKLLLIDPHVSNFTKPRSVSRSFTTWFWRSAHSFDMIW